MTQKSPFSSGHSPQNILHISIRRQDVMRTLPSSRHSPCCHYFFLARERITLKRCHPYLLLLPRDTSKKESFIFCTHCKALQQQAVSLVGPPLPPHPRRQLMMFPRGENRENKKTLHPGKVYTKGIQTNSLLWRDEEEKKNPRSRAPTADYKKAGVL